MKQEINRMCFICRKTHNKQDMLRIVKNSAGEIFIDKTGKANGRGAYICRDANCIEQIKKQKIPSKAFKCEVPLDVYQKLCEELIDKK